MNTSNTMQQQGEQALTLAKSCDLDALVTLRVSRLEGKRPKKSFTELLEDPAARLAGSQQEGLSDLYVSVQVWADNRPLTTPFYTPHKPFSNSYTWSAAITLPIKYRDLPRSAQLAFTIFDVAAMPYPKASSSDGEHKPTPSENVLRSGDFLPNSEVVGGTTLALFGKKHTLRKGKQRCLVHRGKFADGSVFSGTPSKTGGTDDKLGRLEKLVKKQERGDIPHLDWLDKLTFRQIEKIHAEETEKSTEIYLYVDLPRFDFPVVFSEIEYPPPSLPFISNSTPSGPGPVVPSTSALPSQLDLFTVVDPEIARDNPVEAKHTRLHRSHRNGPLDRELRPEKSVRDDLNRILGYPPTQPMTRKERDLIWRFRFYLSRDKRALTKFLKSVVWSDAGEVKQAVEVLLPLWCDIALDDALELLGPAEEFRDPRVRGFAVRQLERADDEELMLYLLQLVQALKFEGSPSGGASNNITASMRGSRHSRMMSVAGGKGDPLLTLENFLVERSVKNSVLGNQFHWYLAVECEDKSVVKMYKKVAQKFADRLQETEKGRQNAALIQRQIAFMDELARFAKDLRMSKDPRPKKIEKLKATIRDARSFLADFSAGPLPFPLDASVSITGIDPEKSSVFKSNLMPLRLCFLTDSGEYPAIFKNGDDMRQDQLVIQLFTLMDRLLRKEHLDLKLTPYRVLATGAVDGLVQFMPSRTLGDISSTHNGNLLNYLRAEHPDEGSVGTYGVAPAVLDNFVRSCAGYCVLTYILGVGDRHLDNLMLSPDGHFFHVDFGYILGRDPKFSPPAVKVCQEMVDAMGGVQSPHYNRFKSLCYTAFISLRKSSNLIINLVALMVDANIPDIKLEPDKAVMKVQEKFRLDLSDEDAIKHFDGLLNETSYITVMYDKAHTLVQYWRA